MKKTPLVPLWGKFHIGVLCVLIIFFRGNSLAQEEIAWEDLSDVEYTYDYVEGINTWYGTPTFGEKVKQLDGKKIILEGYVIPLDVTGGNYMLSAYPYQMCFFCGGAGQESIVELRLKTKKTRYKMDDVMKFSGTLRLNDADLEVSYILEGAKPLR